MSEHPRATYRVQLNSSFTFDDVAAIAPYLADLGISHVYCSPYLQAYPGSTHGYDVVDHSSLNEELGGRAGFDRMTRALEENGLRHIVDIVPNHVSIEGGHNQMWWDVLKLGRASRFAPYFDIDWNPDSDDLAGKVLVPVLGDPLEIVLERGEVTVIEEDGDTVVRYFEHRFPVAPGSERGDIADVLARQHYLLAHWRSAARRLNYRRFFDINDLAALEMDAAGVFEATHDLILQLVRAGRVDGLRVDHIDGLRDPLTYLRRLRRDAGGYLVVEKILEPGEDLRDGWPVHGTTGYDFLNTVAGLFVDPRGAEPLTRIYSELTGEETDLATVTRAKKMLVLRHVMASDINRLTREFLRAFPADGADEDEVRIGIAETIAAFHVYRTYASPDGIIGDDDRKVIEEALAEARRRTPHIAPAIFDRLGSALLMKEERARAFALRFQQTTGPVMAKGVEDTVFYNYNRLVSLNEVGGDPGRFGVSLDEFHATAELRAARWPAAMLATATHDTKRGEDVRSRIALLSEIPEKWREAVERWSKIAHGHRTEGLPDRDAQYLFFQTLVGAYPLDAERAVEYMRKASKEAKRHTSWIDPRPPYDDALERFVRGVLADDEFMAEVASFVEPLIEPGRVNSLAQTLIKLTYPGVPDTYQGTEMWDGSLVDPDNRRPVDYARRADLLRRATTTAAAELWGSADDGAPKMLVTARALRVRVDRAGSLGPAGSYRRLVATGGRADHALAYIRGGDVAVIAPRLVLGLSGDWADTRVRLPDGVWRNELTGVEVPGNDVPVGDLLRPFPVALLTAELS
ncbi:MAG: malto-oligosyltrehalose synthase [Actinomycetota bacterium]